MILNRYIAIGLFAGIAGAQTTTFTAASTNNTSASSNFAGNTDTRAGVLNPNYEPIPRNVSNLDVHDLVTSGFAGKIFVNFLNWFSTTYNCTANPSDAGIGGWGPSRLTCNSHILTQYNSNDATQVHAQMNDIASRHFDGVVVNYEAKSASGLEIGSIQKIRDDLDARCAGASCPVQMVIMTDGSGIKFSPGFGGATACPQPGSSATANENCIIAHMKDDLCYMNQNYFGAPSYLRVSGHPVWQSFIIESGWTLNSTGAAPSWDDLWIHVQQFANNLAGNCPALSATYANAPNNGVPDLEFENASGFSHDGSSANSQGAFAWIHPGSGISTQTSAVASDLSDLTSFYQAAQSNSAKNAWGAAFSAFNDVMAGWSPAPAGRIEDNGCGRTWLNSLAAGKSFLPGFIQAVTWNDYDEGTQIETGIDNCVSSLTASISGNTLSWAVNFATRSDGSAGDDSTIDRFNIYDSSDGQNLTLATGLCNLGGGAAINDHLCTGTGSATRSIDLKTLLPGAGIHKVYVQAVGKPSILNHITAQALTYEPVAVTVSSQTSGTASSPLTVTASAASSATVTGWHIYVNGADDFSGGTTKSISTTVPLTTGANTVIVRAWNSTGAYGDQTFTITGN